MEHLRDEFLANWQIEWVATIFDLFFEVFGRLLICGQKLFYFVGFNSSILQSFNGILWRISFDLQHFRVALSLVIERNVDSSNWLITLSFGLGQQCFIFEVRGIQKRCSVLEKFLAIVDGSADSLIVLKCHITWLLLDLNCWCTFFFWFLLRLLFFLLGF